MKHIAVLFVLGGLMSLSTAWAVNPASELIKDATVPKLAAKPASGPTTSPAVSASENAGQPGKLRPESSVVPQVSVPLRSSQSADPAPPAAPNGKPDDRAAACAAHVTKAARDKCNHSL